MEINRQKPLKKKFNVIMWNYKILWWHNFRAIHGTSYPRLSVLHQLINWGYKVIFTFIGIKEYTKLRPH